MMVRFKIMNGTCSFAGTSSYYHAVRTKYCNMHTIAISSPWHVSAHVRAAFDKLVIILEFTKLQVER